MFWVKRCSQRELLVSLVYLFTKLCTAIPILKALQTNRKLQGKGFLSNFGISDKKVIEVDSFLGKNETFYNIVKESHPEICFMILYGQPLTSKHNHDGINLRLKLLEKYAPGITNEILKATVQFRVPIHDATVPVISQFFELKIVPDFSQFDKYGIPMQIVYPDIPKFQ